MCYHKISFVINAGEQIVSQMYGTNGSHGMAIVGYNDNIWFDHNFNGNVDEGEMGAFKIVNSWGEDYANGGFIWVSYDALNTNSCLNSWSQNRPRALQSISRIDVMPYDYSGDFHLKATLKTATRYNNQIHIKSEHNGTVRESVAFSDITTFKTDICAYDGTTNYSEGTFVFPLKNVAPDLTAENFEEYTFTVTVESGLSAPYDTVVSELMLVNAKTGKTYTNQNELPFSVNGSSKTVELNKSTTNNVVVYYRGYDNPTLHYYTNGTWNSAKMEYTLENNHLYKYVIPTSSTANVKLYFTDNNSNTDNNNGSYYTAANGLNCFNTDSFVAPLKATITKEHEEYDMYHNPKNTGSATGGYGPYQYQFVYKCLKNNDIYETQWSDTPVNKETFYRFFYSGDYVITFNVKDFAGNIASDSFTVTIEDVPFRFTDFNLEQGNKIVIYQPVTIFAKTIHEEIINYNNIRNIYTIDIKKDGVSCYNMDFNSTECDTNTRISTLKQTWVPTQTGVYTMTISSYDAQGSFAEKSYTFEVFDHKYGDVDCNTEINIRDATLVQLLIARFVDDSRVNRTAADVNKDNSISISDATAIQLYVTQLDGSAYVGDVI